MSRIKNMFSIEICRYKLDTYKNINFPLIAKLNKLYQIHDKRSMICALLILMI